MKYYRINLDIDIKAESNNEAVVKLQSLIGNYIPILSHGGYTIGEVSEVQE